MAETTIALTLLVGTVVFWGSFEVFMQTHERAAIRQIQVARQHYEQQQLKQHTFKAKMVGKHAA
ncbi:histidine kinase [Lactiplantibacillus daowaiensis]|uniref:Uncharacterized protein n=1 Tax=Lactiplantibacillus daowaiensis TaxID=2559918 RepID=A0ABW1RZX4_9LACO|nr:histidine kinase [Lactiplantibacillus daowaiensis]